MTPLQKLKEALEKDANYFGNPHDDEKDRFVASYIRNTVLPLIEELLPEEREVYKMLVDWNAELLRRQLLIKSEPDGIVRETMINNLLLDDDNYFTQKYGSTQNK